MTYVWRSSSDLQFEVRYAPLGPIMLQLVSPIKGDSQKMRFLMNNGEGVDNIAFNVDDLCQTVVRNLLSPIVLSVMRNSSCETSDVL